MTRNSETSSELVPVLGGTARRKLSPLQLRLRVAATVLLLLNLVAGYLYLFPPGGSRQDLELQSLQVRTQILAAQKQAGKMRALASNVQQGSNQAADFTTKYFLPKRTADVAVY
jgi:hypothetical protein